MMTCASPALIACDASMTALSPDPHTLLTVTAETLAGIPALSAAWRAGAWPVPPWITWPMITSCTSAAGTLDRLSAARMATAPSSGALNGERAPRNLPMGVRAAPTITRMRDLSGMITSLIRLPTFEVNRRRKGRTALSRAFARLEFHLVRKQSNARNSTIATVNDLDGGDVVGRLHSLVGHCERVFGPLPLRSGPGSRKVRVLRLDLRRDSRVADKDAAVCSLRGGHALLTLYDHGQQSGRTGTSRRME